MSEDLKPYKVEVDDHSDDCGTVYRLTGPNMSLTSKHEQDLQDRADDLNLGFEAGRAPLPRKEWKAAELHEIIEYLLVRLEEENADDCDCGTDEPGSCVICRAKAVLSGGGDERWVLDELKSIVKDLAETDRPEPTKENMWFRNLRVRASKLMPSLESQASGKVKPNE